MRALSPVAALWRTEIHSKQGMTMKNDSAKHCRLYDPSFKYVKSAESNISKTFARIRREQAKQSTPANVTALKARKAVK